MENKKNITHLKFKVFQHLYSSFYLWNSYNLYLIPTAVHAILNNCALCHKATNTVLCNWGLMNEDIIKAEIK